MHPDGSLAINEMVHSRSAEKRVYPQNIWVSQDMMEEKPAGTFDRISAARAEYSLTKEEKQSEEKARHT